MSSNKFQSEGAECAYKACFPKYRKNHLLKTLLSTHYANPLFAIRYNRHAKPECCYIAFFNTVIIHTAHEIFF